MKKLLKNLLPHLVYFYGHLRYRMFLLVGVSIFVGLMDGLGLAMFLPLLELVADQNAEATSQQMGNLEFILIGIRSFGLELNLTVVLITMLFFFILKGIAKWLETFLNTIYQQFFIRKIRVENINALTNYDYNAFVKADAGRIQNTMSGEVQRVMMAFKAYSQMLQQLVIIMTYVVLAFLSNPEFASLVLIGGVVTNFIFSSLYRKTKKLSGLLTKSNHSFQGLIIQEVAFFKYLKATGKIKSYSEYLKKKVYEIENAVRSMGILNSIMMGAREPLMMGIVVTVILIQVNLMGGSLGTIILSLLFFYRGLASVMQLQTNYNKFLSFSGSLSNMTEFVSDLKKHREINGRIKMNPFQHAIEIKDVSFQFESAAQLILKEINLLIPKNQSIALVGESGSGKTTLMNIIGGLLLPSKGKVMIDGINYVEFDKTSYQSRIGYITQEPVIFDDTIFNNVTFWAEKTVKSQERFWVALRSANIDEFVSEQPQKEEERLGNNGINLSGGQKQRISIARELYKEVEFLFMDEATSALDSETEKMIQGNIDKLKGQYTILIIAHRLSTIVNADQVIVMKKGEIEHMGNYSELINESSSFKRMVDLQEL